MEASMELTRNKIVDALITALIGIQQNIVDEPERISEETVPIGDLYNFDSLASVEATVNVLVILGFEFDEFPSYPSLFISKQQKALTVGQVADRILRLNSRRK
jgi:acyl carrier protein